ncbi:MAG: hypothetical protein mread185_000297 [Mycoplasmataceae bacterium]|nr:MAG: hypothetical protein mread185_000297 [Mycoplasmataceae bacterium]
MTKGKLLKFLFWKFKWKIFFLFFLTFLINYVAFLIRFNLLNNLSSFRDYKGHFFYLFGKYQITIKEKHTNWKTLLLILFLLYFPLKLIIHLTLDYWKKNYQKETENSLIKKLINYADKKRYLMNSKIAEKVEIINNIVPEFARQFINIPVEIFGIIVDFSFILFNLYYLIKIYNLSNLIPLMIVFILANLIWFILFNLLFFVSKENNITKKKNYQSYQKSRIKIWLENLASEKKILKNPIKLIKLLDSNHRKITNINFISTFHQLPSIIIPGINILFLFLYYCFYRGGEGGLGWDVYFIASDLQRFVQKIEKSFNLLSSISDFKENYRQIKSFFN